MFKCRRPYWQPFWKWRVTEKIWLQIYIQYTQIYLETKFGANQTKLNFPAFLAAILKMAGDEKILVSKMNSPQQYLLTNQISFQSEHVSMSAAILAAIFKQNGRHIFLKWSPYYSACSIAHSYQFPLSSKYLQIFHEFF